MFSVNTLYIVMLSSPFLLWEKKLSLLILSVEEVISHLRFLLSLLLKKCLPVNTYRSWVLVYVFIHWFLKLLWWLLWMNL